MKRWTRRNLPKVLILPVLAFVIALAVLATTMGSSPTPVAASPERQIDNDAYQSRLLAEAYTPVEHETDDISGTYVPPAATQEADSEPCAADSITANADLENLAIVIYQEAGGDTCCDLCRYRVADVVLNRVNDPRYPDTIEDVLTDAEYGPQWGLFSETGVVWPEKASLPEEAEAVQRARDTAAAVLDGQHSDLSDDYIWCSEYKQGSNVIYCDGIYFGAG